MNVGIYYPLLHETVSLWGEGETETREIGRASTGALLLEKKSRGWAGEKASAPTFPLPPMAPTLPKGQLHLYSSSFYLETI